MLTETNLQTYLTKVNLASPEVSLLFLKEIQSAHVATFPFSSIAVLLKQDLSLDSEKLFERVILNERGGYCFEMNKIFFELLTLIGFDCELTLARVLNNRDIDAPRTHRVTRVRLNNLIYLVDVGCGGNCPREPLLLSTDEPQTQRDVVYKITQPREHDYLLQMEKGNQWFTLYTFDDYHYTDADCSCGQ